MFNGLLIISSLLFAFTVSSAQEPGTPGPSKDIMINCGCSSKGRKPIVVITKPGRDIMIDSISSSGLLVNINPVDIKKFDVVNPTEAIKKIWGKGKRRCFSDCIER